MAAYFTGVHAHDQDCRATRRRTRLAHGHECFSQRNPPWSTHEIGDTTYTAVCAHGDHNRAPTISTIFCAATACVLRPCGSTPYGAPHKRKSPADTSVGGTQPSYQATQARVGLRHAGCASPLSRVLVRLRERRAARHTAGSAVLQCRRLCGRALRSPMPCAQAAESCAAQRSKLLSSSEYLATHGWTGATARSWLM